MIHIAKEKLVIILRVIFYTLTIINRRSAFLTSHPRILLESITAVCLAYDIYIFVKIIREVIREEKVE